MAKLAMWLFLTDGFDDKKSIGKWVSLETPMNPLTEQFIVDYY